MEYADLEKMMVLPYLVGEEQYAKEYAELFNGEMLKDASLQKKLIESIVSSAKGGVEYFSAEYPTAQVDLSRHALNLLGMNKKGKVFTQDKELLADAPFLLNSLIYGKGKVYSEEVAAELLAYESNKKGSKYTQEARAMLDSYLSDMVMERLKKIANDAESDNVLKQAPQVEAEQDMIVPPLAPDMDSESPQQGANVVSLADDSSAQVANDDVQVPSTVYDKPGASIEPSFKDISSPHIVTKELADALEERMLNILSESEPMMQRRGFTTKVADLIKYKAQDLFDPIPLRYPSEPLFSESLVHMDANGRASSEPLLQFKFGKVIMPNAKVDDAVYKIMAIETLRNGVKKPHIKCDFSNPKTAQDFLLKTVDELIEVGYDINDMSVQPKMQKFFDALKASKLTNEFSISETRPDEKPELKVEPEAVLTQEEAMVANNKLVTNVTETLSLNQENPIPVNQLSAENLNSVLMADAETLSTLNQKTHKEVKSYVGNLVKKANPETGKSIGPRELEKLGLISVDAISNTFGDSQGKRFTEIMENAVSLAADNQLDVDQSIPVPESYGDMGVEGPPLMDDLPPLDGMDMPPYIELEMDVDMDALNQTHTVSNDSVNNDSVTSNDSVNNDSVKTKVPVTLVDHGKAPYQNVKNNKLSYFIKTSDGKETWGVGLKGALERSSAKIGDEIELSRISSENITISVDKKDDKGVVIGKEDKEVTRVVWEIESQPKDNQQANVIKSDTNENDFLPPLDGMDIPPHIDLKMGASLTEDEMALRDIEQVKSDMTYATEELVAPGTETQLAIPEQGNATISLNGLIEMDPAELESRVLAEEPDVMGALSSVLDQDAAMLTQSELGFLSTLPSSVKERYADKLDPILGVEELDEQIIEQSTPKQDRSDSTAFRR
jgi:hypothetical protein